MDSPPTTAGNDDTMGLLGLDGSGGGQEFAREGETDFFFDNFQLFDRATPGLQVVDDFFNQIIGGGRTRR